MRFLVASVVAATVGASGAVLADDQAEQCFDKATLSYVDCPMAPMAPALPSWTGPYLGLHAGYAAAMFDGAYEGPAGIFTTFFDDIDAAGFMGGGQIGYLHQLENDIVTGFELSGSWVGAEGSTANAINDQFTDASLNWLAEARLRVGYALYEGGMPVLPYLTGGVALAGYDMDSTGNTTVSLDETALGGVGGAGVEIMLDENVSASVEGVYYYFDDSTDLNGVANGGPGDSFDFTGAWAARAKVNFHF